MKITIAVCTWNRANMVDQTLQSLTQLRIPPGIDWEVVVVNNNSPDNTADVLESYVSKLPLRHFLEKNQGIAFARNRAASEARGEWILWTDDDIQVKPNWLSGYVQAFIEHPECGFFGGPVELNFDGVPPAWLVAGLDAIGGALGQVRVKESGPIGTDAQLPFNCNMAVLSRYHRSIPYDTRYGRKAGGLVSGEETVFLRELLARGVKGRWLHSIPVLHSVPAERQSVKYLRRALNGVGHELGIRSATSSARQFRGVPLWLWRDALTFEARFRVRKLLRSSAWHGDLAVAAISWGRIERMLEDRQSSRRRFEVRASARS
jgi:glycosyltransferase involved in cell wall biosynthesis